MGEVFSGVDGEYAGGGQGGRSIDRPDPRMRMRRALHEGVGLPMTIDVIDVIAATGDKTLVLDPADRLTDAELLHGR